MGFRIARSRAELDRLHDLLERAAPQPIVVVQIGISLGAGAPGAVAWRAIVAEYRLAPRPRQGQQRRILLDIGERGRAERDHLVTADLFEVGEIDGTSARDGIMQHAGGISGNQRPGRIDDPIAERPDDAWRRR